MPYRQVDALMERYSATIRMGFFLELFPRPLPSSGSEHFLSGFFLARIYSSRCKVLPSIYPVYFFAVFSSNISRRVLRDETTGPKPDESQSNAFPEQARNLNALSQPIPVAVVLRSSFCMLLMYPEYYQKKEEFDRKRFKSSENRNFEVEKAHTYK